MDTHIKIPPPFNPSIFRSVVIPILLWIAFTPWSADLDLKVSHFFYQNGNFDSYPLWNWLYIYGILPAWFLAGFALIGLILSFTQSYRNWRAPCLYVLLVYAVGSGLIIHAILKDHWGRPRPKQVTEFGGIQAFRPYYKPNIGNSPEPSKSFTSGHAASGYYFFALTLLGMIYRSQLLYWLGLGLGWGLGILLSLTRIAQGGHFLSDTFAAAIIMWLTAWGLAYLIFEQTLRKKTNERVDI